MPEPIPQYNPIDRAAMPRSVFAELVKTVPDDQVRAIVRDLRSVAEPSSLAAKPSVPVELTKRTNGWREAAPLDPPPGIDLADRLIDQQDRIDRLNRALALAKAKAGGAKEKGE